MKRSFVSSLLVAACLTSMAPVLADGQSKPAATKNSPSSTSNALLMVPGFVAGFFVGMPIYFVRKLPHDIAEQTHGIVGTVVKDENNKVLAVPALAFALPMAAIVVALETPVCSLHNAWMAEKPFSKEQFSLGDLDN